jgi:hypothetical protein
MLVRLPRSFAYLAACVAITTSWSVAMVRSQEGMSANIVHVFVEGLQLPWLSTLGRMSAQYLPWLEGRPSPAAAFLFAAAMIVGIWAIPSPGRSLIQGSNLDVNT